jgi:hypothetical protein
VPASTHLLCLNISFPVMVVSWSIVLHIVLSDRKCNFVSDFLFCVGTVLELYCTVSMLFLDARVLY